MTLTLSFSILFSISWRFHVEALEASSSVPKTIQDSWSLGRNIHDHECRQGFEQFGRPPSTIHDRPVIPSWWRSNNDSNNHDEHYIAYSLHKSNAGPDASTIENSHVIFQSKQPIFTKEECQELIDEARHVITVGLTNDKRILDHQPTNSELGEAKLSTMPKSNQWFREKLHWTLFPILQDRFGVDAQQLTLTDALVIGYGFFGNGARSQPIHRDSSLLSLNIALSPTSDYIGGGTYFEALDTYLHQDQGHLTCHAGGTLHAGNGISSGERWILVLFVLDKSQPQLARRCHSLGLDAQREKQNDVAKLHFEASLSIQPNNHLVYKDMGRTWMQLGNIVEARNCLAKVTKLYPLDVEAGLGLAKLLLQAKRPRAALRRLESLLACIGEKDLKENAWMPLQAQAWEARIMAVQCAIYCAQRQPVEYQGMLPVAIERLTLCLKSYRVQSPPKHLLDMMDVLQHLSHG